jgi:hypothetical protein
VRIEKFGSRLLSPRLAEGVILQNNSLQWQVIACHGLVIEIASDFSGCTLLLLPPQDRLVEKVGLA